MFKLIAHTGEWTELYVSERASPRLRSYMPPTSVFIGNDKGIMVSEVDRLDLGEDQRPRMVILIVENVEALDSIAIHNYLHLRLADDFKRLIAKPGFDAKSYEFRNIFRTCQQLDKQIPLDSEIDEEQIRKPVIPRFAIPVLLSLVVLLSILNTYNMVTPADLQEMLEPSKMRIERNSKEIKRLTTIGPRLAGSQEEVREIVGRVEQNI